jgi:hypothetical protein
MRHHRYSVAVATCLAFLAPVVATAQTHTYEPRNSPPLPLFRCDGQRPPVFGADNCANWRLMKKQEHLIDLQIKELERKQGKKGR